ncbi:hypothetical protein B0H16DRAFT_1745637 [Mycena metata]|uniref:Uncharacterized protein n=1 Tax=Mycena metata TaxID=1033252 RepID=A0AAD7H1M1_9AGAR|nr:hypothetical protein B0H16DRAFT_1745637 [Mycena metata]
MAVLDWAMIYAILPCLKVFYTCMMGQLDSDTLASFLNQHPHITILTVEAGRPFSVNTVLVLPELEDITGPLQLITLLSCVMIRHGSLSQSIIRFRSGYAAQHQLQHNSIILTLPQAVKARIIATP